MDLANLIKQTLIVLGKPFYFIISHVLIALICVVYIVGNVFRTLIDALVVISRKLKKGYNHKKKIHKVIYTRFRILPYQLKLKISKIHFPKLNLPKYNLPIKRRYLILVIGLTTFIFFSYYLVFKDLPSPTDLLTRNQEVSTKIFDRNNILLYTIYKDKNRTPIKLSEVPESVKLATLAAEDAEFYTHPGFSIKGIIRAITKNLKEGRLEGGSTITQQLVKNALLSPERTYIRKIRELILSVEVEMSFSKDEILEMYLNEVNYGGTVYGIEEASKHYFGKSTKNLTLAEGALLAGLPQSPSKYSPFGDNPDLTFSRQREVLHLMRINRYITFEDEEKALNQRILFAPDKQKILAPHFVMYIKDQLINEFGEEVVQHGGLEVKTTLDINIQNVAEKIVKDELNSLKRLNVGNAAVIVLDTKTNEILAMVGSKDYFDTINGGNVNVTTRPRQPGSSIKVVNYAVALANGTTLATIIDDSPISFNVAGQKPYAPKNYDGKFRGKIPIRLALAESRNIPAVKILASYGVNKMIDLGQQMGITTWGEKGRFGLSLTLGGGEVKLIDLAKVYSVIANYGNKKEVTSIIEIKNYKGKIISKQSILSKENNVLDPRVAYLLIDVLKDNEARSKAFGRNSTLVIPNHPEVAVKTGTSNDLRDNLTVGFNQDYLVAVWVGNNDNSPMNRVASGITGASSIWNKIVRTILNDKKTEDWIVPNGLIQKDCYNKKEWFLVENQLNCPKIIEPAASIVN